jgi:hypothetical protein
MGVRIPEVLHDVGGLRLAPGQGSLAFVYRCRLSGMECVCNLLSCLWGWDYAPGVNAATPLLGLLSPVFASGLHAVSNVVHCASEIN